jgi:hypothetical protein
MASEEFTLVVERLDQICAQIRELLGPARNGQSKITADKEWYTTQEAALILNRAPWTVRQWCRLRRVQAKKRLCGRGLSAEWMISQQEIHRIQNEGLLPLDKGSTPTVDQHPRFERTNQ